MLSRPAAAALTPQQLPLFDNSCGETTAISLDAIEAHASESPTQERNRNPHNISSIDVRKSARLGPLQLVSCPGIEVGSEPHLPPVHELRLRA
jgi:hypothetical protein